ncbi:Zinc finger protein, partial [Operophtera brumata]
MDGLEANKCERPFACEMCGAKFSQRSNLHSHRRATHLDDKRHACPDCPKRFKRRRDVRRQVLSEVEPALSPARHAPRRQAARLPRLPQAVQKETVTILEMCGAKFSQRSNLHSHRRATHLDDKRHACPDCPKRFKRRRDVRRQVLSEVEPALSPARHAQRRQAARLPRLPQAVQKETVTILEMCGAKFSQRSNLHSHRRATHLDDKRHACPDCPKRLLQYHIKAAHTGERPLKCDFCDSTFVYPEHYKKH